VGSSQAAPAPGQRAQSGADASTGGGPPRRLVLLPRRPSLPLGYDHAGRACGLCGVSDNSSPRRLCLRLWQGRRRESSTANSPRPPLCASPGAQDPGLEPHLLTGVRLLMPQGLTALRGRGRPGSGAKALRRDQQLVLAGTRWDSSARRRDVRPPRRPFARRVTVWRHCDSLRLKYSGLWWTPRAHVRDPQEPRSGLRANR
jgi:hypothetical protein